MTKLQRSKKEKYTDFGNITAAMLDHLIYEVGLQDHHKKAFCLSH